MGTTYQVVVESPLGNGWYSTASFRLGKAHDFARAFTSNSECRGIQAVSFIPQLSDESLREFRSSDTCHILPFVAALIMFDKLSRGSAPSVDAFCSWMDEMGSADEDTPNWRILLFASG